MIFGAKAIFLTLLHCFSLIPMDQTLVYDDYAIALRDTPIYASLETYAEIISNAESKQFFPVISIVEDQYGIVWSEVTLPDGKTGFLLEPWYFHCKELLAGLAAR